MFKALLKYEFKSNGSCRNNRNMRVGDEGTKRRTKGENQM
jgi:hypothetical protein